MHLYELSHFVQIRVYSCSTPYYTGICVSAGGEVTDVFSFFTIAAFHLTASGFLGLGGIYHSIFGPERLEERAISSLFSFSWQDRFRVTAILGTLSLGTLLLVWKGLYSGSLMTLSQLEEATLG